MKFEEESAPIESVVPSADGIVIDVTGAANTRLSKVKDKVIFFSMFTPFFELASVRCVMAIFALNTVDERKLKKEFDLSQRRTKEDILSVRNICADFPHEQSQAGQRISASFELLILILSMKMVSNAIYFTSFF